MLSNKSTDEGPDGIEQKYRPRHCVTDEAPHYFQDTCTRDWCRINWSRAVKSVFISTDQCYYGFSCSYLAFMLTVHDQLCQLICQWVLRWIVVQRKNKANNFFSLIFCTCQFALWLWTDKKFASRNVVCSFPLRGAMHAIFFCKKLIINC